MGHEYKDSRVNPLLEDMEIGVRVERAEPKDLDEIYELSLIHI